MPHSPTRAHNNLQVFGPPPKEHATGRLSQHGFARNARWELLGKSSDESGTSTKDGDEAISLDFGLSRNNLSEESKSAWPYEFALVYSVTLRKNSLQTMLNVRNEGKVPFEFQMLLHSYFKVDVSEKHIQLCHCKPLTTAVQDISKTEIKGLGSVKYIDKMLNATEQTQTDPVIRINGEVDRVYNDIKQDTTSIVVGGKPVLDVIRDNVNDTVVWNPWIEKTKATGDLRPEDAYKGFVCVEVGAVDGWQKLEPDDTFEGGQILKSNL